MWHVEPINKVIYIFLFQGGVNASDEYFAELDYIEVVERLKEGYESDVQEDIESEDEDIEVSSTIQRDAGNAKLSLWSHKFAVIIREGIGDIWNDPVYLKCFICIDKVYFWVRKRERQNKNFKLSFSNPKEENEQQADSESSEALVLCHYIQVAPKHELISVHHWLKALSSSHKTITYNDRIHFIGIGCSKLCFLYTLHAAFAEYNLL